MKSHIASYRKQYDRVSLTLESTGVSALETPVRVQRFMEGNDMAMAALMFQYGRYLLISSSQPGGQPANLQGIWNHSPYAPWDSKYTININAEMNYWPAEVTNLSETHEPLFDMVTDLAVTGSETAKVLYDAKGWGHIIIRIYGVPADRWMLHTSACGLMEVPGWHSICGSIICLPVIKSF